MTPYSRLRASQVATYFRGPESQAWDSSVATLCVGAPGAFLCQSLMAVMGGSLRPEGVHGSGA